MQSPSTSIRNNKTYGFSFIEVVVVMAIVGFLAASGIIIGIDSLQRYLFRSDLEKAATLLQKARSSAVNNIGESSHGVYFANSENFILFRGVSYAARDSAYDLPVEKSGVITASGLTEIVFAPLSGETAGGNITLSDGVRSVTTIINNEGGITW